MTDNEIIKALGGISYGGHSCTKCKYKITKGEDRCGLKGCKIARNALDLINRQKAEKEKLEYTLMGVMHSVDKWLDGEELEQDEVNRAITMREKTLQIVEKQKAEIERLNDVVKRLKRCNEQLCVLDEQQRNNIKSEAITEFEERLKAERFCHGGDLVYVDSIDQIAKELKGLPTEDNDVKCKDCEYLMFSDCYGECRKAYKGIVNPNDSCGKGKKRVKGEQ